MGVLKNIAKKVFKNGETVATDNILSVILGNSSDITKEQALSIPSVASAVDKIANMVAIIPIKLYVESYDDKKRKSIEEIQDKRCDLLNYDTKDTLNGFEFKKAMVMDYLLTNGSYAYIKRFGNNVVKSIHYVENDKVQIIKNNDPIDKQYRITVDTKTYNDFDFIKILRNTTNGSTGKSVIKEVEQALETAYQNLLMLYSNSKKGGKKRGFLKIQKKLSDTALAQLKTDWDRLFSNEDLNSIVLPEGAEFQESSNSTFEQQVNNTRKQLNTEIDNIFHIDVDEEKTFKNAIVPILTEIECSLNRDLLLEKEKSKKYFFAFDTKEVNKGDMKSRYEAYRIAIEKGIMTPNEVRYIENLNNIDGLDVINFGLGASLYDIETKQFYTPNTNTTTDLNIKEQEDEE